MADEPKDPPDEAAEAPPPESAVQKIMSLVPKTSEQVRRIESHQRAGLRKQAWDYAVNGLSHWQIADKLGVSHRQAEALVREASREHAQAQDRGVQGRRALAVARANKMQLHTLTIACSSQVPLMLRIEATKNFWRGQDHLAKLDGTYAPTKIATTTPDGSRWAPIEMRLAAMTTEELQILKKANDAYLETGGEPIEAEIVDEDETGTE